MAYHATPCLHCLFRKAILLLADGREEVPNQRHVFKPLSCSSRIILILYLAMVIISFRILETGELPDKMECSDEDFQTVCSMIRILVRHASHVYAEL